MEASPKNTVRIETTLQQSVAEVWDFWTSPEHIMQWNFATPAWCCPHAENDLQTGGTFTFRMEAKDGSMGFDYSGNYLEVTRFESIHSQLEDGRKVSVHFHPVPEGTRLIQIFEVEDQNTLEQQRSGWQAILDTFQTYTSKTK